MCVGVEVQLTEDDYRATEAAPSTAPVAVSKTTQIASNVTLRITPVTVERARSMGRDIESLSVPPDDDRRPNKAGKCLTHASWTLIIICIIYVHPGQSLRTLTQLHLK